MEVFAAAEQPKRGGFGGNQMRIQRIELRVSVIRSAQEKIKLTRESLDLTYAQNFQHRYLPIAFCRDDYNFTVDCPEMRGHIHVGIIGKFLIPTKIAIL